ncbi:hypothetical protein OAR20_00930 [Candidatus Pelagibacter sp.]|jgi:hypothetical protein|nr:hypothetical protein [Candidatus Pelagibacter sp.]
MKKKNFYLIATILLLLIVYKTNFLRSLHDLIILSYDDRISNTYGFCDKQGIGYVNFIKKNFNIDGKIKIRNSLKQNNYNSGEWSVYNSNFSEKLQFDYLILINFEKFKKEFDLNDFQILHNFKDCYFLTKND